MELADGLLRVGAMSDDDLANVAYFGASRALLADPPAPGAALDAWLAAFPRAAVARARAAGIAARVLAGVPADAVPARSWEPVLAALADALRGPDVGAVGPAGAGDGAPATAEFMRRQLALAHDFDRAVVLFAGGDTTDVDIAGRALEASLVLCAAASVPPERIVVDGPDSVLVRALGAGACVLLSAHAARRSATAAAAWIAARISESPDSARRIVLATASASPQPDAVALARVAAALDRVGLAGGVVGAVTRENARRLFGL